MKKICNTFFLSLAITIAATAQNYDTFKFLVGAVYATFPGTNGGGYPFLTLEPAYRVNDDVAIGYRIEITAGGGDNGVVLLASNTLNVQYYLSDEGIRPFIGTGMGIFSRTNERNPGYSSFIIYPRLGFDNGHFNMALDYNIIPANNYYNNSLSGGYLGFRIGVLIGGGRMETKEEWKEKPDRTSKKKVGETKNKPDKIIEKKDKQ